MEVGLNSTENHCSCVTRYVDITLQNGTARLHATIALDQTVTRYVDITLQNGTARLCATIARDQTARVRSKQLRSAVFGLWIVYAYE